MCGSLRYWPDWGLNPGFLNIYQVLYQLSYLALGLKVDCVCLDWHVSHVKYEQIAHFQHLGHFYWYWLSRDDAGVVHSSWPRGQNVKKTTRRNEMS